jgi:hypothetical protein
MPAPHLPANGIPCIFKLNPLRWILFLMLSTLLLQLQVCGTLAYVSQTAWIQIVTVRVNILYGRPMDKQKYQEVILKSSLDKDL